MKVIVATEHRFLRDRSGVVYSLTGGREYRFWQRYLSAFDEVVVVARVYEVSELRLRRVSAASGPNVHFFALPSYGKLWTFPRMLRRLATTNDAIILRVPGVIGTLLHGELAKHGKPYALEVVGDPWQALSPIAEGHISPVYFIARLWLTYALKRQCKMASAIAYVTESYLQNRYPPANSSLSIAVSDVDLPPSAFLLRSWGERSKTGQFNLITVASLYKRYKGVDVLIDAVAQCVKEGLNLRLVVVGGGKYQKSFEAQSISKGLERHIHFVGQVPAGEPVRRYLDEADLFVLASRAEGLPRAMLEAMARGLPCIGTTVGGIPELLPPEDLVPPNDAKALADKIAEILNDPERMARMSRRNYQKALEYREEVLQERRAAFYRRVREVTEEWQKQRGIRW
ncbi:MAG: glycosyltransferase family 4 protein [Thermofilaceae archaeon]